jgi:hypothetical protein
MVDALYNRLENNHLAECRRRCTADLLSATGDLNRKAGGCPREQVMPRRSTSEAYRAAVESVRDLPYRQILIYSAGLVLPAAILLVIWPRLAANLFATGFEDGSFMPHGMCYLWVPQLYLMHVSSDLLIGLSYVAISSTLVYLIYRARHDIPFSWMFLAFGLFEVPAA